MDFFTVLILWVITFAISTLLTPKPKLTNARPAGLGDFSFPTATEGRSIPLVWGTVRIDGPNVVWTGDLRVDPIKKKVKTGMFSSKKQTIGYKYFLGMQFALCRGTVDFLKRMWINDKVVFEGQLGAAGAVELDDPNLFGGKDQSGGIEGTFRFYVGNDSQTPNPYIDNTPPSVLWFDDFGDGSEDEAWNHYRGTDSNSYWRVSNTGQSGGYGPGGGVADVDNAAAVTAKFLTSDSDRHVRSSFLSGSAPGNLNSYCGLLVHPDRPRIADRMTVTMEFIGKPASANDFTTHQIWMGVKAKDFGDFVSQNGVYAAVVDTTTIHIFFTSPSVPAGTYMVQMTAPTDFADLSNLKHALNLQVDGDTVTLRLDGVVIYTGSDSRILDIDPDYCGVVAGIQGNLNIEFTGSTDWTAAGIYTISIDSLDRNIISDSPGYRGTCYGVWEGGWLGNSTQIDPWGFEVQRCPNGLALTSSRHIVNGADANPANVVYELLTDPDWGLGYQAGDIDAVGMAAVANILYTEGNGFSFLLDNPMEAAEFLKELERQMDGIVFLNRLTGKVALRLIRADYVLADLPVIDASNIIEIKDFTRGTWNNTTNNVQIQYNSRAKEYKETYALAQDIANVALQGNVVKTALEKYPGVKDDILASKLAWRGLRLLGSPLAKAQFVVNRTMHFLNEGDVVSFSDPALQIVDMPMRVTRLDLGKLEDGQITIDAVEDLFKYDEPSMSIPTPSYWIDPEKAPADIDASDRKIFEAPKALSDRAEENPGVYGRVWVGSRYPGDTSTNFTVYDNDAGDGYAIDMEVEGYLPAGSLKVDLAAGTTQSTADFLMEIGPDTKSDLLAAGASRTPLEIGEGLYNIAMIGDEFIAYKTLTSSGSDISVNDVYRGLMDSVPQSHPAGTRIWILSTGNITTRSFADGHSVGVKLQTSGSSGELDIGLASPTTVVMTSRELRPYPPTNLSITNGLGSFLWSTSVELDLPISISTLFNDGDLASMQDVNPGSAGTYGMRVTFDSPGFIIGVRYYNNSVLQGLDHVAKVYESSGGTLLASAAFPSENHNGWNYVVFGSPLPVLAGGTEYRVATYSATSRTTYLSVFGASPKDRGLVNSPSSGGATVTGDFYPVNNDSNGFAADVLFSTAAGLDEVGFRIDYTRRDFRTGDEVKAVLNESSLAADFPAVNTTEYAVEVYNDMDVLIYTSPWDDANNIIVTRTRILAGNAGEVPPSLTLKVKTRHTVAATVYAARYTLDHELDTTSALSALHNFGSLANGVATVATYTALSTGTFTLNLGTALPIGAAQISLNGGSYTTVVAATLTTGTIAVTTGDVIRIKHTEPGPAAAATTAMLLDDADAAVAYAIFTY